MNTRLVVAEYMTPGLLWLERMGKLLTVVLSAVIVWIFLQQMDDIMAKKQKIVECEAQFAAYEAYLKQGKSCFEEEEFEECEKYYRSAMEILPKAPAPYLGLAELFDKAREYEEALDILEAYQGEENGEIRSEIEELQEKIEVLGQSVLVR